MSDVDTVTFFWKPIQEFYGNLTHFIRHLPFSLNLLKSPPGENGLSFARRVHAMKKIGREVKKQFGPWKSGKVEFVEHHLGHAASAFFVSKFQESAILTIDGRGESTTTLLAIGRGNKIKKIKEIKVPHSLGHLFSTVTSYLGFTPFFDEWKVMGMSAYGNDSLCKAFDSVIELQEGGYRLNLKYFNFHTYGQNRWFSDQFIKIFGPPRKKEDPYEQRHYDIAYALQKVIEKAGVHLAQYLYDTTKLPNLCMTGGVVLNCLMNKEIIRKTPFKEYFIQPIANDAGVSFGSALYYYHQVLDKSRTSGFETVYLGPEFTNEEIEAVLKKKNLNYRMSQNIARETARQIADGKIVGWFQGRMEGGPRALGNRSITVDPTDPAMKERLNARVKKREFFRPFAPSILEEKVHEYFEMPKGQLSPYMILVGDVKEDKRSAIPAVTHADNTARVQTVSKESNPRYWELINEFGKVTGVPVLLNTSFNENEPVVCTPEDAVNCFLRTEFDALAIKDFLVVKE